MGTVLALDLARGVEQVIRLPVLKEIPNFPMRHRGERVYLHDRLGGDFSAVVLAHAEGPGVHHELRLRAELARFKTMLFTLVVVEAEPPECLSSPVIWDENRLLLQYLGGCSNAVLLIRPDRHLLGLVGFGQTETLKTHLSAMLPGTGQQPAELVR